MDLGVGSGTHGEQTARVMIAFERVLLDGERPDLVRRAGRRELHRGGGAGRRRSSGSRCAHLEAGLRSFDRTMPEEINRLVTDHLSDLLLTPSPDADENLRARGIAATRDRAASGTSMIDTLLAHLPRARALGVPEAHGARAGRLRGGDAAPARQRRRSPARSRPLLEALAEVARLVPVVFPVHPRTRARLAHPALAGAAAALRLVEPLGYLEFLSLTSAARLVLTDSGGLQEETTALGVPCLTLRENTERPVTVTEGTNEVVGGDPGRIVAAARRALGGEGKRGRVPALWDGRAGERAADAIVAFLRARRAREDRPGGHPERGLEAAPPARPSPGAGVWSAGDAPGAGPLHG